MEVVAAAVDPIDARDKIKLFNPDVLTLDIEMPKMDGITFLRNLMRLRPMPVVMISSLTERGAPATLDALEIGAVDYVAKPKVGSEEDLNQYAELIKGKLREAAQSNISALENLTKPRSSASIESDNATKESDTRYRAEKVICIGSSTGGTEAIREVLIGMPVNCPPILIAQHIPAVFSASLAERLNRICSITVQEARAGIQLEPGNAYLAPGDFHLKLVRQSSRIITALDESDKVSGHRPSVDVLFQSALSCLGKSVVAAILTGMGSDGAQGLKSIRDQDGETFAQDEDTSVVWGMPGAAVRLGAVKHVLPIGKIRAGLLKACAR